MGPLIYRGWEREKRKCLRMEKGKKGPCSVPVSTKINLRRERERKQLQQKAARVLEEQSLRSRTVPGERLPALDLCG